MALHFYRGMMRIVSPNTIVRLNFVYQEDSKAVSGLTNMKVKVNYENGTSALAETAMEEIGVTGEYYYDFNTTGIDKENLMKVYYIYDADVIGIEEFIVDIVEDQDGQIL